MTQALRIGIVVLLQTLALGAIVADRALILATGREVVLETEPVDPRDLFRGDYVTLNYTASQVDLGTVDGDDDGFATSKPAYVVFKDDGGTWRPAAIYHARPASSALAAGEVAVKAAVVNVYTFSADDRWPRCPGGCDMVSLSYGVESYFVPEGTGEVLEDARNDRRLEVVVAVRGDGRAAIKALKVDGRTFAEEGLF